jgi:hypothetical protein
MASSLIGSLRVALGLDTAQFEAGANKSRSIARGLSKDIESSFKSAKVAVEGLVAAFAVGALTNQIKQSLQWAAAIGTTASTLGVTTKQLQEFRFAASQTGVAQEQLEGGLQKLTVSMGKAEVGSQAQIKAFNAIGISVDQLKGKNTGQVFELIANGLKNVTDRSQRAAIEVALFGRAGAQLDSLLSGGTDRLNALGQAAQQLGVVLSDEQIQNAEVTAHKLEALKTVLEANVASVVTQNASSILSLAQALSTLTNEILHFFSSNPQLALGIIGGLAGSRFGVAGAALGAAGGAALGDKVARNAEDANMDLRFRIQKLQAARDEVNARRAEAASPGSIISFRHGYGPGAGATIDSAVTEFKRQKALLDQATAARLQPKATPPGVNLPQFLAPKGPKGRKAPADRSDEILAQMDKEILQADQQVLEAKQQLAGSAEERLQISVQQIELERTIKDAAVDEEVAKAKRENAEHKITDAALQQVEQKARILKAANDEEAAIKLRALVEEQLARAEQANFEATDQQFKFREEALHTADQLATTAADHRRIQLEILDSEIRQKKLELQHELDLAKRNGATAEEIAVIQAKIDNLSNEYAQGAAVIDRNTQSPLQAYFQGLPHTADEVNQALQNIEVNGIEGLSSALAQAGKGWGAMRDAAISALQDIAQQLIQLGIQRMLFSLFGNSILGGIGGGAGGAAALAAGDGGTAGFIFNDSLSSLGFADGGFVSGRGTGMSDSIPAMLSNGEYVMSADAVRMFGPRFLDMMNEGKVPHKKGGGLLHALSFLSPALFLQSQGLLRFLSPGAFLANKAVGGGHFNPLALLSPLAFLATGGFKHFDPLAALSPGGFALSKLLDGEHGGKGHTFNINVNAPSTGNPSRDRQTSLQQAADVRQAIGDAVAQGLI